MNGCKVEVKCGSEWGMLLGAIRVDVTPSNGEVYRTDITGYGHRGSSWQAMSRRVTHRCVLGIQKVLKYTVTQWTAHQRMEWAHGQLPVTASMLATSAR